MVTPIASNADGLLIKAECAREVYSDNLCRLKKFNVCEYQEDRLLPFRILSVSAADMRLKCCHQAVASSALTFIPIVSTVSFLCSPPCERAAVSDQVVHEACACKSANMFLLCSFLPVCQYFSFLVLFSLVNSSLLLHFLHACLSVALTSVSSTTVSCFACCLVLQICYEH